MEKSQQSIWDSLVDIIPLLNKSKVQKSLEDGNALYDIWNSFSKTSNMKFSKPANCDNNQIKKLEKSGLIADYGNEIKITEKGANLIKVMILNDKTSTLDKKSSNLSRIGWYKRIKNETYFD